ncbi:BTAD domain-containing putative transcriptional regulator [Saccharomonospora sp.]|uniref:AfsR/SARP family transcriptional regulator n=1 Tax=Saccharomonospora sp. TaxID=33913 RepID=UPI002628F548|nr:BTAD domain-containing putative transcriptional regulator [Saccharomonospora sp.]
MEFRILGPLQVVDDEREVVVPAGRLRVLLAALVCNANRVVSVSELISYLWDTPSASAQNTVRSYVRRLRACLREIDSQRVFIRQRTPGYVLDVDDDEVDLLRFRSIVSKAYGTDDPRDAAELFRSALELWRGEPLADIRSEELQRGVVASLCEEHTRTVEARIDRELEAGAHVELVSDLTALVERHPLRERFWGQLMSALARSGRQADALAAYRRLRATLAEELGIEPGPELRRLHEVILSGEIPGVRQEHDGDGGPGRTATSDESEELSPVLPSPRQLIADTTSFVGRGRLLDDLARWLTDATAQRLLVVSGQPGVGKTALAVRLAHRVAEYFPDGQLFVDLHGFSSTPAVAPADLLTRFLRALGCSAERIPDDMDERTALLRSLLAGRRVLLVLDNAATADQVRPLLPGETECAVIITSRNVLSGLVALDGARAVRMDVLTADESTSLLSTLLKDRDDVCDEELRRLADACGRLPLALRIAAAHLATRREVAVSDLLEDLSRYRLDVLTITYDGRACVRTAIDVSYAALSAPVARLLMLLSLLPTPEFAVPVAAALCDCDLPEARRLVAALAEANLVEELGTSRYRLHDLVWVYLTHRAEHELSVQERFAAARRMADFYLHTVISAGWFVRREPLPIELPTRPDTVRTVSFDDLQQAVAWYEAERVNLVAVVHESERRGWHQHAYVLPIVLCSFYLLRKHWSDWEETHTVALRAARRSGDRRAESAVLHRLGALLDTKGRSRKALDKYKAATTIARELGDPQLEASALTGAGAAYFSLGRLSDAYSCYQRALELHTEAGNPYGQVGPLVNTTRVHVARRDFAAAFASAREAIKVAMAYGSVNHPGIAWLNLGEAYLEAGHVDDAIEAIDQAGRVAAMSSDRDTKARSLNLLAVAEEKRGDMLAARRFRQRATLYAAEIG